MNKVKKVSSLFVFFLIFICMGKVYADKDITSFMVDVPDEVNLTYQGTVDWAYFNNLDFSKYEKKSSENRIKEVNYTGKIENKLNSYKAKMSYTDGKINKNGKDENKSIVFLGKDSGFDFSITQDGNDNYINLYVGVWAAKAEINLLVNDEIKESVVIESQSKVKNDTKYYLVKFKTSNLISKDKIKISTRIKEVYDDVWGNINLAAITLADKDFSSSDEILTSEYWNINHKDGILKRVAFKEGDKFNDIPLRNDEFRGVTWKINGDVQTLKKSEDNSTIYVGNYKKDEIDVDLSIKYEIKDKKILRIIAGIKNNLDKEVKIDEAAMQFGFNTYLEKYPDYNSQLFPTLLRVEPTHAWGYFQMPNGNILVFNTDNKVASYTIDYQKGAHRIYSAQLDVLKSGRLPDRHPKDMDRLSANEKKEVVLNIYPIEDMNRTDLVKKDIAKNSDLPMFDSDMYTIDDDSDTTIKVYSNTDIKNNELRVVNPDNSVDKIKVEKNSSGIYSAIFRSNGKDLGVYKISCTNEAGYTSEMCISIRNNWSWYIKAARKAAIDAPQKGGTHAEQYYGFYSAYIAKKYFPDTALDEMVSKKLDEVYSLMYYNKSGKPASERERIQNHSTMMGILIDSYEADKNKEHLWRAEVLADFLVSKQRRDGGYYSWFTDYTSVIYPAKSLMEMSYVEKELSNDQSISEEDREKHKDRYEKYMSSLEKAMDKLVLLDGNFDTEGQQTYEDGANSCTVTQLSEFALMFPKGSEKREKYKNAAIKYFNRHTSHQQLVVPDSRMNGATLRFWEAQYDISIEPSKQSPNMMNSPHGWSAWNVYALFNLYELTGDKQYLIRGENAIGTLSQLMGNDGVLNWAFIPDPQRKVKLFVEDKEKSSGDNIYGRYTEEREIGEQYLPMVSYWWKAKPNTYTKGHKWMPFGAYQGCGSDQDVHEVFKAIGEVNLTKAYVYENEDGTLTAYNCKANKVNGKIDVIPKENVVNKVSFMLKNDSQVDVHFYNGTKSESIKNNNFTWIDTEENLKSDAGVSDDAYLKDIIIKDRKLFEKFDKDVYNYNLYVDPKTDYIELKPIKNNEKQEVFIDGNKIEGDYTKIKINPYEVKEVEIKVYSEAAKSIRSYYICINSLGKAKKVENNEVDNAQAGSENSENGEEGPIKNLFDKDKTTIWYTNINEVDKDKRYVEVAFNKPKHLLGLKYLPKQFSGLDGTVTKYKILLSKDNGLTYFEVLAGNWDRNKDMKTALFDYKGVTNLKFVVVETMDDDTIASGAELEFIEFNEDTDEGITATPDNVKNKYPEDNHKEERKEKSKNLPNTAVGNNEYAIYILAIISLILICAVRIYLKDKED